MRHSSILGLTLNTSYCSFHILSSVLIITEYSSERMYHNLGNHYPTPIINNTASKYLIS